MAGFSLDDYVDVAERIQLFRDKHPEGSLQSEVIAAPEGFIAMRAYAYRFPEDPRPGVGHAWEPLPGRTPYTKDSELMVCETSAWGRAIVAALAADTKRGVASANEVRNRTSSPPDMPVRSETPGPAADLSVRSPLGRSQVPAHPRQGRSQWGEGGTGPAEHTSDRSGPEAAQATRPSAAAHVSDTLPLPGDPPAADLQTTATTGGVKAEQTADPVTSEQPTPPAGDRHTRHEWVREGDTETCIGCGRERKARAA